MPKTPHLVPGDVFRIKQPKSDQPNFEFTAAWYELDQGDIGAGYVVVAAYPPDQILKFPLIECELVARANPIRVKRERTLR